MRKIELDARLGAIARRAAGCAHVADIGADHGYLACFLLEHNPDMRMTVSDISAPSLEKARRLMDERGLTERVRFCVSDGLDALEQEADAIVIAGMGAKTICDILRNGREKIGRARLLMQPNLNAPELRAFLWEAGFDVLDEQALHAAGRHYLLIEARLSCAPRVLPADERDAFLGAKLCSKTDADTIAFYTWQWQVRCGEMKSLDAVREETPHTRARRAALQREIDWLEEVL